MYRGYRVRDVLDEYSVTFVTMLAAGYRQLAVERLELLSLISAPHMEQSDREELIQRLQQMTVDPDLIEIYSDDYSGIETLKGFLD